ncbi:MAG: sulfide/dihydroorotate dehydrogenase-like FAD/NAD-binding protein [Thermoprotei archaeon]|nr:MAG: sulfide/dihydroorotate dehydrogenase-like FAD/NAD-binding protein [Thermoprotei archaeon]
MFKILSNHIIAPEIRKIEIYAPEIAKRAKAGQFVVIRVDERGERIPLTLVDWNPNKGSITLVFQEVGVTTKKLGRVKKGKYILDVIGPLGNPTEVKNYGTIVGVGGGVGNACLLPVMREFKRAGNYTVSMIGARTSELLILEDELSEVSDELYIATDDGSRGYKGFVTDLLKRFLERRRPDLVYAVGPTIMMKVVSSITKPYGVKTIVSLNPIMVDGTGMCGACRVIVGGKLRFACIDGPEFDGHQVNFDALMNRLRMYKEEEELALSLLEKSIKR